MARVNSVRIAVFVLFLAALCSAGCRRAPEVGPEPDPTEPEIGDIGQDIPEGGDQDPVGLEGEATCGKLEIVEIDLRGQPRPPLESTSRGFEMRCSPEILCAQGACCKPVWAAANPDDPRSVVILSCRCDAC